MTRLLAVGLAIAPLLTGCGGVYYAVTAGAAQARLEEARELGAETKAPYEYYYAKAHIEEAAAQASRSSYSDAAHFAETGEEFASKAAELSRVSVPAKPTQEPK